MASRIELRSIGKSYPARQGRDHVFNEFSLALDAGSITAILGKSGCGKSTLLHILHGLEQHDGDLVVPDEFQPLALVPQTQTLLPWKDVRGNATLGCVLANLPLSENWLGEILEKLDLERYGNYYPHQLSGGMARKVLIARALAIRPKTLLLDEPLSNLDFPQRAALLDYLEHLRRTLGGTVVLVTHDVEEAAAVADRIIVLAGRPASVILDTRNEAKASSNGLSPSLLRRSAHYAAVVHAVREAMENHG